MTVEGNPVLLPTPDRKDTGLRRRAPRVAWASVAGAAAVMIAMIFVSYRLHGQIEGKKAQLKDLETRYSELDTNYRELETSFNQLRYLFSLLPPEPPKGALPPKEALPATGALPANAASKLPSRVYLDIANESQRSKAEITAARLRSAGYIVPRIGGILCVGSLAPKNTQLRYFQRSDEQGTDLPGIIKTLQQSNVDAYPQYVPPKGSAVRPGQFELWFGPGG
ncbi:MAG TPA: hypothetical protein VG206_20575 [Terriglobia bacterium]|nr:hypothetical protein [Terriglobia bacterium]